MPSRLLWPELQVPLLVPLDDPVLAPLVVLSRRAPFAASGVSVIVDADLLSQSATEHYGAEMCQAVSGSSARKGVGVRVPASAPTT